MSQLKSPRGAKGTGTQCGWGVGASAGQVPSQCPRKASPAALDTHAGLVPEGTDWTFPVQRVALSTAVTMSLWPSGHPLAGPGGWEPRTVPAREPLTRPRRLRNAPDAGTLPLNVVGRIAARVRQSLLSERR